MEAVFVYGTLKRGFRNSHCLADSDYVGSAITADKYHMGDTGSFPEVRLASDIEDPEAAPLRGEVCMCDETTMATLDRLEGNGRMYKRQLRTVLVRRICGQGTSELRAWIYIWLGSPCRPIMPVDGELTYT